MRLEFEETKEEIESEEIFFVCDGLTYLGSEAKARGRYAEYLVDNERTPASMLMNFERWVEINCEEARECDECGQKMNEGFVLGGGETYYCSKKCLHKHHTPKKWAKMHKQDEDNNYWTQWEV